jgi:hypothetical protein
MSKTRLMDENAYLMFLELTEASAEDVEIEDALYFVLEHYQRQGIPIDYDEMNLDSVRSTLSLILKSWLTIK